MEFAGLILFLILIYWRPQDFMPVLEDLRVIFIVMGASVFLWILRRFSLKTPKLLRLPQDYFMLGLWAAVVLSTFRANWLTYTKDMAIEFGKITLFYFLVADVVNTKKRVAIFSHALVILTTLIAGIAILQRFGMDLLGVGMVEDRIQGAGIYNNPNYLAYSLIFIIPLGFHLLRSAVSLGRRLVYLLPLVVSYWAVFWTKSRGGLLCLLAVTVYLLAQGRRRWVRNAAIVGGVVGMMAIVTVAPRFEAFGRDERTIQARIDAWYGALGMLKGSPLFGVGVDRFPEEYAGPKTTHSSFVHIGAELGLLGLFMWVGLLYHCFKSLKRPDWSPDLRKYALGLEGSLIAYLVMSFFATFPYRITIYILCGMSSALWRASADDREKEDLGPGAEPSVKELHPFRLADARNIGLLVLSFIVFWHLAIRYRY